MSKAELLVLLGGQRETLRRRWREVAGGVRLGRTRRDVCHQRHRRAG
jgi:hypothetical protein